MYTQVTLHKQLRLARDYKQAVLDELMEGTWDVVYAGYRHRVLTGTALNLLEASCGPWCVSVYAVCRLSPRQLHSLDVLYHVPAMTDLNWRVHKDIKALTAPVCKVDPPAPRPLPRRVVARGFGPLTFSLRCYPIDARWIIAGMQDWGLSDGRHEIDIGVPDTPQAPLCFFSKGPGWGWVLKE
jgi:hypothetical protein